MRYLKTSCIYVSVPELGGEVMGHRAAGEQEDSEAGSLSLEQKVAELVDAVDRYEAESLLSQAIARHHLMEIPESGWEPKPFAVGVRAAPELLAAARAATGRPLSEGQSCTAHDFDHLNELLVETHDLAVPIPHWVDTSDISEIAKARHSTRRSQSYLHMEADLLRELFGNPDVPHPIPCDIEDLIKVALAVLTIPLLRETQRRDSNLDDSARSFVFGVADVTALAELPSHVAEQCLNLLAVRGEELLHLPATGFFDGTTPLREYPLLSLGDDKYLNVGGSQVVLGLRDLLENYLKDSGQFSKYSDARGKTAETLALDLLTKIIRPSTTYSRFHYQTRGDKATSGYEADIVMQAGSAIFVIEVKAGGLRSVARRGLPNKTRQGLYDVVGEGARQAERLATEILGATDDEFVGTCDGRPAPLWVDGLTHVVPLVVTLEYVSGLVGDVSALSRAGIFPDPSRPPLVLQVSDLRIFADLMSSPAELIYHWEFRRRLGEWDVSCRDELDLLLYDLDFGSEWLPDLTFPGVILVFNPITYRVDAHYVVHEVPPQPETAAAPLPTRPIGKHLRQLRRIDNVRRYGFITDGLKTLSRAYRGNNPDLHLSLISAVDQDQDSL